MPNPESLEPDGDAWLSVDLEKLLPDEVTIRFPDGRTLGKADLLAAERGTAAEFEIELSDGSRFTCEEFARRFPELRPVRSTLAELSPGLDGVIFELRSGESLTGEFIGFGGELARLRTAEGDDEVEVAEIIEIYIEGETEGPE